MVRLPIGRLVPHPSHLGDAQPGQVAASDGGAEGGDAGGGAGGGGRLGGSAGVRQVSPPSQEEEERAKRTSVTG